MNKENLKILKSKYFLVLFVFIILALSVICWFWFLDPEIRQARQYKQDTEIFTKKIQEQEEQYAADIYGAETPEATYQLFLEALQKQDIDLASKYFILDRQEEYKELLAEIEKSGQWDEMIKDLSNPRNQRGKLEDENTYVIEIINDENISVTTIVLRKPQTIIGIEKKLLSDIWKIVEF